MAHDPQRYRAQDGMKAFLQCGSAYSIQNREDGCAKCGDSALAWNLVIEQEMSQFVRQREPLFCIRVTCVKENSPPASIGQQASMQAAVPSTNTVSDFDTPRPGQYVGDTQAWNWIDLERQGQGDRGLHIAGETGHSSCKRP